MRTIVTLVRRLVTLAKGSAWTSIGGRCLLIAGSLLLLAWIGRAATAATPPAPSLAMTSVDAGVAAAETAARPPEPLPPPPVVAPAPPALASPAPSGHARATPDDPVYVNHAGVEDLRRLPGVGAKRAEAIIALRQRVGRFQRIEELLRVKGVGRTTVRKWRPLVRLDAPMLPDAGGS
jgi:competence protein ComEA